MVFGFFKKAWSYDQMPDLSDKVAMVTGGSTGLGKQTCLELARKNATVYVLGRDPVKTNKAIEDIKSETGNQKVYFLQCDLMDLRSVVACADDFLKLNVPLHVLVNNAGIMAVPFQLSKDGIESQFATNHFSHFVLTKKLLSVLEKSAPARIVNLSSSAHQAARGRGINFEKLNDEKSYSPWMRYGETKLSNILFTTHLAKLLKERGVDNVYVNVCHPGVVKTELTRNASMVNAFTGKILGLVQINVVDGAKTQTFLASDDSIQEQGITGKYYVPTAAPASTTSQGANAELARECWEWSEKILKEKLPELF